VFTRNRFQNQFHNQFSKYIQKVDFIIDELGVEGRRKSTEGEENILPVTKAVEVKAAAGAEGDLMMDDRCWLHLAAVRFLLWRQEEGKGK